MNIISIYDKLKSSYKNYIRSFVSIKDERIKNEVSMAIQESKLWPKALIQFNPNFAQGIEVTQLIEKGLPIHKDLERFFKTPFYKHQQETIEAGFAAGTVLETTIEDDENDTQSLRYIFQGHGR